MDYRFRCFTTPLRSPSRRLWIANIKLAKHVTRRQRHFDQIRRIPRTECNPPIKRFILQFLNNLRQLIDPLPSIISLSINVLRPKMPPLEAINRP